MRQNYQQIYRELTFVTEFNENTSLYIYKPTNHLYVVKHEDKDARAIYETLSAVSNPHLAKVFYIADSNDHIDVLQEYIAGEALDELLLQRGNLTEDETKRIIADVCDGLYALHQKGIIHRDINPKNIIINSGGTATIIDFGIARTYHTEKRNDTTLLGTPGYAAPEQFGFSQSDSRTDIYAVGVLMNVMLTGELPNVKRPKGTLGKIINKCVEIDSKRRYKSIAALNLSVKNNVTYNGPADKVIRQIPGLRSKNAFVVIFALLAYIAAGLLTTAIFATADSDHIIGNFIAWVLLMPVPFSCFHNFLGIWDKLPFTKGSSKRSQIIIYVTLGVVSILIGLITFGRINAA